VKAKTTKVSEVMTRDVISVVPETPIKEVAEGLVGRGISGVPVCADDGRVLGVLSEADLLVKQGGPSHTVGGLFAWLVEVPNADDVAKLQAHTAGDAMTSPAITIGADEPAAEAARVMVTRRINRLPVVEDGRLVGIVTRADFVRLFTRSDDEIAREIREGVLGRMLWIGSDRVHVSVDRGEAAVSGEVESEFDAELVAKRIALVPGVVGVSSQLSWTYDAKGRPVKPGAKG
jgi:CBS domain-containing protein